ncbi:unnamed protein product [Phaedon cochleariae]|uniref:Major facilitator superfamily (MFS) profile domain-containing protein n=1 Tax=Phaedon cochleariae TaxID=80249 RepID=A0A9P0GUL7_PHACE|nr:unnamed protein product [Phaedon cochleariae]
MFRRTFSPSIFQYLAAITGAFAATSYGINSSWTSPFSIYLTSTSSIIPMTSESLSWCAISPLMGCFIGALIAANISDRIGRKSTILIMAPVVFLCCIGIGYVRNIWYLVVLRMIIGVTDGAVFTALPMYIGEIAEPRIRGFLSSLVCLFFISGVLIINTIGSFFTIHTCSMISACIPVLHFIGFCFMPESPYYYIKAKQYKRAEESLMVLRGTSNVSNEFQVMTEAVRLQEDMVEKPKITDLFTIPSNRKALSIFVIICLANRASGKGPLMYFTRMIFALSGSDLNVTMCTLVYCGVELVIVMIATYFIVDRFGKRFLTITSSVGCIVTLSILTSYFLLLHLQCSIISHLNWLPLTTLLIYNVFFSIGISFTHMCYLSELFPTSVKATALSFAEIFTVVTGAIGTKFFQMTIDYSGTLWVPFCCFATLSLISLFAIIKFVPETKGKSLEEIQLFLREGNIKTKLIKL